MLEAVADRVKAIDANIQAGIRDWLKDSLGSERDSNIDALGKAVWDIKASYKMASWVKVTVDDYEEVIKNAFIGVSLDKKDEDYILNKNPVLIIEADSESAALQSIFFLQKNYIDISVKTRIYNKVWQVKQARELRDIKVLITISPKSEKIRRQLEYVFTHTAFKGKPAQPAQKLSSNASVKVTKADCGRQIEKALHRLSLDKGPVLIIEADSEAAAMESFIIANRYRGARAALCWNIDQVEMTRRHNNANVLVMLEKSSEEERKIWADMFTKTDFDGNKPEGKRHKDRVDKIGLIESQGLQPAGQKFSRKAIGIASDHGGFKLKEKIIVRLRELGFEPIDEGTYSDKSCDYPDFGKKVGNRVALGAYGSGILICTTGEGISIAGAKSGLTNINVEVRVALCLTPGQAEIAVKDVHANILALGARYVRDEDIDGILKPLLDAGNNLRQRSLIQEAASSL